MTPVAIAANPIRRGERRSEAPLLRMDGRSHAPDLRVRKRRSAAILALPILLCANAAGAQPAAGSLRPATVGTQTKVPELARVPELIVRYTNELRKAHGVEPTAVSESLSRVAGSFAEFMARTDQYGHNADGSTPAARAKQHGYNFCMVAENIAYQFHSHGFATEELAQRFVQGWESSPGHRKSMLDADAMETGAAVARSPRTGRYYAVQMFGRPQSAMYSFQVANQSGIGLRYAFAGKEFELPPRSTRTHQYCRAAQLTVHGVGAEDGQSAMQPVHGDRFAVVRDRQGLRLLRQ